MTMSGCKPTIRLTPPPPYHDVSLDQVNKQDSYLFNCGRKQSAIVVSNSTYLQSRRIVEAVGCDADDK